MKLARILLAVAAFFLSVSPSAADVTYLYVGNNFTTFTGTQFNTSEHVSATLTFSTPLAAGLAYGSVTPTSWSINDGTMGSAGWNSQWQSPGIFKFSLATDSSGNISQWSVDIWNGAIQGGYREIYTTQNANYTEDMTASFTTDAEVSNPGTWTKQPSPVPEPCSISLALTGVGALVARRRKKALRSVPRQVSQNIPI